MHSLKFFLITATVFFVSIFESHVQALIPINSDGEVSIISRSGGSIAGKTASSTTIIKYPPNGLLSPTEKSFPKGFSKQVYSYQQSSSKVSNAWYEEYHLYEDIGLSTQSLITFSEYLAAPFKVGEESNNRNKTYVYLVKESLDTIEAFGGIGQYFTYAGKQGFLRYEMLSANQETYNLIWDDNGKVLTIAISVPPNVITSEDVIALLTTLRRSNGKKLLDNTLSRKPPIFITKPVGIDPNFKGSSVEGAWGTQSDMFGMPDVGVKGLLVPSEKTLSSDYYYLRTNTERRNETEGMSRYVFYAIQSLAPMSLRFDETSDKTYTRIVALKDFLSKGGQSGTSKVTRESFTYSNSEGVIYSYWHHNRLNYELHWNDDGKDMHIRMEHVPKGHQVSSATLITLLSTLRRSDGFYSELLALATSTNQSGPIIYEAGIDGHEKILQAAPPQGLLIPTQESLKRHFGNVRQAGIRDGYEVMYSPQNLNNRFTILSGPIIVFREFLASNKPNSYEVLSKKDTTDFLHSDIPINFDTDPLSTPPSAPWPSNLKKMVENFTYNNHNGILYSYEGSTTIAYSLHYDDDGKDLQIMIKNAPKTFYTNQQVIDILKTMQRSDGVDFVKKDILDMFETQDKATVDTFSLAAPSTWHFLHGFLGPTKASLPENGYYRLTLEPDIFANDPTYDYHLSNSERGSYRLKYYLYPDSSNVFFFKETLKVGTSTPYETLSKKSYDSLVKEREKTLKPDYKFASQSIASEISTKDFVYKGAKGVLYSYTISVGCQFYDLHYNDKGNDMEITTWFCPKSLPIDKKGWYTPEQVINILGTLKRY